MSLDDYFDEALCETARRFHSTPEAVLRNIQELFDEAPLPIPRYRSAGAAFRIPAGIRTRAKPCCCWPPYCRRRKPVPNCTDT